MQHASCMLITVTRMPTALQSYELPHCELRGPGPGAYGQPEYDSDISVLGVAIENERLKSDNSALIRKRGNVCRCALIGQWGMVAFRHTQPEDIPQLPRTKALSSDRIVDSMEPEA